MRVIHKHDLALKVPAVAVENAQGKTLKLQHAARGDGCVACRLYVLNNAQRVHIGWRVARHQLADAVIRRTNAVLLAQIGQTVVLQGEIQPRFLVHIECVEQVVQAAMVDVRMRDDKRALHIVKVREQAAENLQHLVLVAREAAVDEQQLAVFLQNIRVAPARRLDDVHCKPAEQTALRNARAEVFAFKAVQHFGDFADVRKRLVRRFAFFVKVLHQKVGVCNERVHIFLRQVQGRSQLVRKRKVKHRVIEHLLAFVVV